jgi:hypothetical protein
MLETAYCDVEKGVREDYSDKAIRYETRYDDAATYKSTGFSGLLTKKQNYYKVGGIEVIDYIKAKLTPEQFKGYLLGNIYKYSGRCQYKGEYVKDVMKLAEYTQWLKDLDDTNS